jgi:hypothetical protein
MANTYTKIAAVTVGVTPVATIDFSSIPSTYTDLILKLSLRTNRSGIFDYATINFNNLSTNYILRTLGGDGLGGGASSFNQTTFGVNLIGRPDGATATSNTFASFDFILPNYGSANYKNILVDSATENADSTAYIDLLTGEWTQTAAINRLTITNGTANSYVQYSTATLYGISNA